MPTATAANIRLYHFENFSTGVAPGNVDRANGIIRKVAVITNGVSARGHDMEVDETTLKQLQKLAAKKGKVSVKLDHGSGITSVCGHLKNFALVDKKLVADWHLLKTHKEYETTMERAETMPECFGMSAAFMGGPVLETGESVFTDPKTEKQFVMRNGAKKFLMGDEKKLARATELRAVDCVTDPAANPDGLFSEKEPGVDNKKGNIMPTRTSRQSAQSAEPAEEPTLADIMAAITQQNETIQAMQGRFDALEQSANPKEYTLDELDAMSDEELTGLGVTREALNNAILHAQQVIAEQEAAEGEGQGAAAEGQGAASVAPAVATALSNLQRTVDFMVRERNQEKRAAKEAELARHFDELDQQFDAAKQEIVELRAKNEALELSLKTGGGRALRPNSSGEVVLFSAKQGRPTPPAGSYENIVETRLNELLAKGINEVVAKAQAVEFGVKNHPDAYAEYRQRHGKIQLSGK